MDRKTILAFALIIIIILLMPYYYQWIAPPQMVSPMDSTEVKPTLADTSRYPEKPQVKPPAALEAAALPEKAQQNLFPEEKNPRNITVETPLYRMTFSTRGGVLTSCLLKEYRGQADGYVELIRPHSAENLNVVLFRKGQPLDLRAVRFAADKYEIALPAEGQGSLTLRATTNAGQLAEKKFLFSADSYQFEMRLRLQGVSDLDPYYELYWGSGMAITELDTMQDIAYSKAYAYMGGELEKFSGKGDKELHGGADGETQWVAQRSKYFEIALVPISRPGNGVLFGIEAQQPLGKYRPRVYSMALRMPGMLNRESAVFKIYCGPLDQKLLKEVHPSLQETMNWGWAVIEPFSKLVLWTLKALHGLIPNYGLVLILFSVLVKVVVWPLTHKSTRSMSRMAALQPRIKELQEKYKGNPEKLNKATMQLYKEEGVNPFSGCWPTLLQMPLLYALFIIFRSTIELRGEPFIFWINDLSRPDIVAQLPISIPMYGNHIAVLPLFMGLTQILMSRVMISDPKQKMTMYIMPIFMIMIFNNFPSGLTLYYALFNLWTYLQQAILRRQGYLPAAKPRRAR